MGIGLKFSSMDNFVKKKICMGFLVIQKLPESIRVLHAFPQAWVPSSRWKGVHRIAGRWNSSVFWTGNRCPDWAGEGCLIQSWGIFGATNVASWGWCQGISWVLQAPTKWTGNCIVSMHYLLSTWWLPSLPFSHNVAATSEETLCRWTTLS